MKNGMKSVATIALVSALALVLFAVSVAPAMASTPPTPYIINGYVIYEGGNACNGSVVTVTNLNTDTEWQAETNATSHYYELVLASGTDVNASEVLQFDAKDIADTQFDTTQHTVTQTELNIGGLFNNITLHPPPAPDLEITDVSCTLLKIGKRANVYAISYNITNIGDEKAGRSVSNLTVDGNVTKKKDRIDALLPGETFTRVIKYRSVMESGTILKVCADCKCKIEESNEENNCGTYTYVP